MTLLDRIRMHPLASFMILANLLSWIGWTPYILSEHGLGIWRFSFPELLGSAQLAGMLPGAYLGPIGSALLVTAIADGRAGLRSWAARLWRWRVRWHWYVGVLLGVPAALLLVGLVSTGGAITAPPLLTIAIYVPMLVLQMVTTGLAEEPGWRDFALPRLQRRFGPLRSAAILGPVWALWHMPLFLTEWGGWPDAHWSRPLLFAGFCIAFNVVMAWVFNRTGESLPMAMLLHVSVNTFMSVVWYQLFPGFAVDAIQLALTAGAVVAAAIVLVGTRGRLGYEPAPRASEHADDALEFAG